MFRRIVAMLGAVLALVLALATPAWATRPQPGPPVQYPTVNDQLLTFPLVYKNRFGSEVYAGVMRIYLDIRPGGSSPYVAASSEVLPASNWRQNGQSSANCRILNDSGSDTRSECLARTGMASAQSGLDFGGNINGIEASVTFSGGQTIANFASNIQVRYVPGVAAYDVCTYWRDTACRRVS
jgi:hypothetical protein